MILDNYSKVANVIVSWIKPRAMALVKQQQPVNTINEYLRSSGLLRNFINFFGIDLMNYNVVDELGFLIEPFLKRFGGTHITEALKKIASVDEIIPTSKEIIDAALSEASKRTNHKVNIFGISLDISDLQELKTELDNIKYDSTAAEKLLDRDMEN